MLSIYHLVFIESFLHALSLPDLIVYMTCMALYALFGGMVDFTLRLNYIDLYCILYGIVS